jgi:alginate O-acetyltransferase complex protein AlgI
LMAAVAGNLITLGYFKYTNFFVDSLRAVSGLDVQISAIVLPIGISFFTFTQIAFLVDTYQGKVREARFLPYLLFVTYFPHLIAGPVLHHAEMMPQFGRAETYRFRLDNVVSGTTLLLIGLVKKVVLADGIGYYVAPTFAAAQTGRPIDLLAAWAAALTYALQLYFDFSGYSDMAIGAARCFGVTFPANFDSPYKSTNIIEFWRRWHMTLSRFLRDYLYISLGGNRRGTARRYINLMITMLLGGLWHGANWTFVAWGGLHGIYLVLNHLWHALRTRAHRKSPSNSWRVASSVLTFVCIIVAWVFFRADTFSTALNLIEGMTGMHGVSLPEGIIAQIEILRPLLRSLGVTFVYYDGAKTVSEWVWIFALLAIVLVAPNTQELTRKFNPVLEIKSHIDHKIYGAVTWYPSVGWAAIIGAVAFFSIISITRVSEFLYWQF